MRAYWEVDIQIHVLLTSTLVGAEWSVSSSDRFIPREKSFLYQLDKRFLLGLVAGQDAALTGAPTPTPQLSNA
jgi:hypothetical protein